MSDDVTRRTVLASGAAVAATGLVACSAPAASPGAAGAATTSGAAATSGSTGSAGVTVKIADVPVGGGKILDNAKYVVTQPTSGSFKAFNKTCPHQGCPVSKITGTEIVCACHNSKFNLADGSVTQPPATKGLAAAKVTVQGDSLIITD